MNLPALIDLARHRAAELQHILVEMTKVLHRNDPTGIALRKALDEFEGPPRTADIPTKKATLK